MFEYGTPLVESWRQTSKQTWQEFAAAFHSWKKLLAWINGGSKSCAKVIANLPGLTSPQKRFQHLETQYQLVLRELSLENPLWAILSRRPRNSQLNSPTKVSQPPAPRISNNAHTFVGLLFKRARYVWQKPSPHPHEEQTVVTTPSPPPLAMKIFTYTPPDPIEYYYWGLRGTPRLLARSSNQPWTPPTTEEIGYDGNFEKIRKVISVVGRRHPIQAKLDQGLRQNIRQVLASMEPCRWTSVDYVRLGYDQVETNNPVVVWVTVEENQVPLVEAQRIVDALAQECRRAGLPDVEVEMTEGQRTTNEECEAWSERLPMPIHYPYIGSSIAREGSKGVGSLGGYIQIDGEIMGLTNHHVAFGDRLEAFPTAEEESSGVTYKMLQPAERDLYNHITHFFASYSLNSRLR